MVPSRLTIRRVYSEDEIVAVLIQVVKGLIHLNSCGIVHGDVKLHNLVYCGSFIKIIDLCGATLVGKQIAYQTDAYAPPG
jgi:serine/threonine protein kinase